MRTSARNSRARCSRKRWLAGWRRFSSEEEVPATVVDSEKATEREVDDAAAAASSGSRDGGAAASVSVKRVGRGEQGLELGLYRGERERSGMGEAAAHAAAGDGSRIAAATREGKRDGSSGGAAKSMYRFISFGGVLDRRARKLWESKLPMKLRVFVWQATHNRLPTGVVLKSMKWKGESRCPLCGIHETVDHILFQCIIARFVWSCFKEALGWDKCPFSLEEVYREWIPLGCAKFNLKPFSFAIIWWGLWLSRNKMRMEHKFPVQPCNVLLSISFKIQRWMILLEPADKKLLEEQQKVVEDWVRNFNHEIKRRRRDVDDFSTIWACVAPGWGFAFSVLRLRPLSLLC
ncbi:hypothetical protein C2845_PM01G23220 [Panicum miliaceum]|uniref:Reverse transcriptase zinc-binding domain-containing protein n=1 Tax=Panicum miliaceum TaxID=4540 RepID=A0A3L6TK80_PANMI|nr:hypothetical protein C2845_PM01G23220 [Panicum miliaceum]